MNPGPPSPPLLVRTLAAIDAGMGLRETFERHLARASEPPAECDLLTESTFWAQHGPAIWKPKRAELHPAFYPVYRWGDLYSYSLLALMLRKGRLDANPEPLHAAARTDFDFWGGNDTLDRDITRLGGAHRSEMLIKSPEEYAARLVDALRDDVAMTEQRHPSHTNLIMCGGKDSLNLLLLPWKNPTVALSATPNYDLVCQFVAKNRLPLEVQRLEDKADSEVQEEEALLGCCRTNLSHWRWGTHLQQIARERGPRLLFWKGQVADLYTTPKWKAFIAPPTKRAVYPRKAYKLLSPHLPAILDRSIGRLIQPGVIRSTWSRCAALQGSHMEFLRELTGCLFLSAYHGPKVQKVWCEVDLASAAPSDMRHLVGRSLLGREVEYPNANPAPSPSPFRVKLGEPAHFFSLLDQLGFPYQRA
jgi:hypothetical protein